MHRLGWRAPVQPALFLAEAMRVRGGALVLRDLDGGTGGHPIEHVDEQVRAEPREVAFDVGAPIIGPDRPHGRRKHGSGIERLHDAHDPDTGFAIAGHHGALDGRRATVPGQQRRVDIDDAQPWRLDQAAGRILPYAATTPMSAATHAGQPEGLVPRLVRLQNRDALRQCQRFTGLG